MKHPFKLASKQFPKHGAKLLHSEPRFQQWLMPWGEKWNVFPNLPLKSVQAKVAELKARQDPMMEFVPCAPPQWSGITEGTTHFTTNYRLMAGQPAQLNEHEVFASLYDPTEVRYSARTGSYAFCRDRLAIIVAVKDDGTIRLVSPWWTRPDLWEQNPRNLKEITHV